MLDAIARRGPDAQHGVTFDSAGRRLGGIDTMPVEGTGRALLHTRLSIRDPRPEADQPMSNEGGDIWLCYNGEVYGWEAEARNLAAAENRPFRTRSDTEFILRGYEAWGIDGLLPRLRGMFAIAIFDLRRQKIVLARDRLGLKPLVYFYDEARRELGFSSLVRALVPYLPAEKRGFSHESIDAYLAHRYVPAPRTIFSHLQRLEAAHLLSFDISSGRLEKRCYWEPAPLLRPFGEVLDEAVTLRTVADRPVGVFLSSGIDSTAIASRLAANGYTNISTYTAGFDDPALDESSLAEEIAASLGMANKRIDIPDNVATDFIRIVADLDEPFADPSSFPTWYLSREAAQHVKVVLCGDGGDELFGGYKRYRQHLRSAWRRRCWPALPRAMIPRGGMLPGKGVRLLQEATLDWLDAYPLRFSGFTFGQRLALQPDAAHVQPHWWRMPEKQAASALPQLLEVDRLNYLPEYILRKADLVTMAHGLEARAPLLDHPLVETIYGLPEQARITRPAKQALAPYCPPCRRFGLYARKKRGFNPPLHKLVGGDLGAQLPELGRRLAAASEGLLSAVAVDELVGAFAQTPALGEQVLQIVLLDESLRQLSDLRARRHDD